MSQAWGVMIVYFVLDTATTCQGLKFIHLEPTEHPKGGDHFDELEQMLDKKHLPDQPQKPTVVVTAPKKRGLFSQVLGLFKKRK